MGRGDPGAPSPGVGAASGRPGRARSHLAGGGVPPGGGCPPQGQGPFLFLRKKKRALTPRQNEFHSAPSPLRGISAPFHSFFLSPQKLRFCGGPGAGLRWVGGRRRRLSSLRTVVRTSPGRYGHAVVEQRWALSSILRPPGCATLAAECDSRSHAPRKKHDVSVPLYAAGKHFTTPALREAPAGGGWVGRKLSLFPNGRP